MTSRSARIRDALGAADPGALRGVVSVYVFGSSLHSDAPRDLDLLVVYDPARVPPSRAAALREIVAGICPPNAGGRPDIVLLTPAEAEATDFARREQAELVYERAE